MSDLLRTVSETVLETTDALIFVLDENGVIQYVNASGAEATGRSAEALRGQEAVAAIIPDRQRENFRMFLDRLRETGTKIRHRSRIEAADGPDPHILWNGTRGTGTAEASYILLTGTDVTAQRRLEREVVEISESERQRIGRELHDTVAPDLFAAAISTENLRARISRGDVSPADLIERLGRIESTARSVAGQARSLSHLLAGGDLEPGELASALRSLVETQRELTSTPCALHLPDARLPSFATAAQAGHLYRIVQEAVRNAARHAQASRIDVHVQIDQTADGDVMVVEVRDDGVGIPSALGASAAGRPGDGAPARDSTALPVHPAESPGEGEGHRDHDSDDHDSDDHDSDDHDSSNENDSASDDESGAIQNTRRSGLGVRLMQYRAHLIGAEVTIDSAEGRGTTVCCRVPLVESGEDTRSE